MKLRDFVWGMKPDARIAYAERAGVTDWTLRRWVPRHGRPFWLPRKEGSYYALASASRGVVKPVDVLQHFFPQAFKRAA